jgi:hypothetical protein
MKYKNNKKITTLHILILPFLISNAVDAALLYTDDFSTSTMTDNKNGYIGGWYGNPVPLGQWFGNSDNVSISSGEMTVGTTGSYGSAAIALTPDIFDGAGTYTLTFDVTSYTGDANDYGQVSVWRGSGYEFSNSSANAIFVNSELETSFVANGAASVEQLDSMSFTSAGTAMSLDFDYDGSSLIGIFMGSFNEAWPFPSIKYDNVQVSSVQVSSVPEPSVPMLCVVAAGVICLRRNRREQGAVL